MKHKDDRPIIPMVAWSKADYERARALAQDELPDTHAEWRKIFGRVFRQLSARAKVVKIAANPEEVAEWCRSKGVENTSPHRAEWAVVKFSATNGIEA